VKKEGAGTIPAKKLLELVRLLPEGEIKFKLLDNIFRFVRLVAIITRDRPASERAAPQRFPAAYPPANVDFTFMAVTMMAHFRASAFEIESIPLSSSGE
jgi:hypothetical protein